MSVFCSSSGCSILYFVLINKKGEKLEQEIIESASSSSLNQKEEEEFSPPTSTSSVGRGRGRGLTVPAWMNGNNMDVQKAKVKLLNMYKQEMGKLSWYCLDFWSKKLNFDVLQLKKELIKF